MSSGLATVTALLAGLALAACTFPQYDVMHSAGSAGSPSGGTAPTGGVGTGNSDTGGSGADNTGGTEVGGSGGTGGSAPMPKPCEPGDADTRCDGLDETCNPIAVDLGCSANCVPHIHGTHTYMRCAPPPSLTFDQAEAKCEANDMHLAVIDDATENQYLVTLMNRKTDPYVWIGGTSEQSEVFAWVTGSVFYDHGPVKGVYQNFAAGGPDLAPLLHCVQFETTGLWSSAHCTDTQAYICEL